MAVAAALGGTLVGLDELDNVAETKNDDVTEFVKKPAVDHSFSVALGDDRKIGPRELANARHVESRSNPYQGIGIGKPLTIIIEKIYLGDYPDALPWVPGFQRGDVLVTSAHKAFQVFERAPRAVHLLEPRAEPGTFVKAKAIRQGSQLVYYSPAVADLNILFTVELSADRDFQATFGDAFAKAAIAAGALPVFASAAPFLVAAGTAIPIAVKAASMLARPQTFYEETVPLNFALAGVELVQPGALVLYPQGDETPFTRRYKLGKDFVLRDKRTRAAYDGPFPYVVISLDGTERPELKGWAAEAASAALLERFHEPDELISKALEVMTESLALYNDMTYRQKAADALERGKKAKDAAAKAQQQLLYQAYAKNIQNKSIRATLETP